MHLFCQGATSSTSFPRIRKDPFQLNKHERMTTSVINKEILEKQAVRDEYCYLYGVVHS